MKRLGEREGHVGLFRPFSETKLSFPPSMMGNYCRVLSRGMTCPYLCLNRTTLAAIFENRLGVGARAEAAATVFLV